MNDPIRILNLFTIMNRGGAETMVMNYYRAIDKSKIQFDFMVHRQERGAYDDEIEAMGGRIFRMCPIYPQNLLDCLLAGEGARRCPGAAEGDHRSPHRSTQTMCGRNHSHLKKLFHS